MSCYEKVSLPSTESTPVHFYMGKIQHMLQYIMSQSKCYKACFDTAFGTNDTMDVLLYADETTGGNVLATASSKQYYFIHVAIKQIGHLRLEEAWWPLTAIPARDLKLIRGQLSAVMALVCRSIDKQNKEGICLGEKTLHANVFALVGDYDAIAKTFAAKGAAGLKPCCLCQNILMKSSSVPMADDYFKSIACPSVNAFQQYKADELIGCYDKLLSETKRSTQKFKDESETTFGFSLLDDGVLACHTARSMLTIHKVVFDSQHNYFSNGIATSEMVLMLEHFTKSSGLTLTDIQRSVREVAWCCANRNFSSPSLRSWLFDERLWKGTMYKGSATQLWYAMPLFNWFLQTFSNDRIMPQLQSWNALMEVYLSLKAFRHDAGNPQELASKQQIHQELFCHYFPNDVRPKHHLRLHMPKQYEKLLYVDCWCLEKKHQKYKQHLADRLQHQYEKGNGFSSRQVAGRLLLMTREKLLEDEAWRCVLKGAIYSSAAVHELAGFPCSIATKLHTGQMELAQNDVFFAHIAGKNVSGFIDFFAESNGQHYVVYEMLLPEQQPARFARKFRRTGQHEAVHFSKDNNFIRPTWWTVENDSVLCLL